MPTRTRARRREAEPLWAVSAERPFMSRPGAWGRARGLVAASGEERSAQANALVRRALGGGPAPFQRRGAPPCRCAVGARGSRARRSARRAAWQSCVPPRPREDRTDGRARGAAHQARAPRAAGCRRSSGSGGAGVRRAGEHPGLLRLREPDAGLHGEHPRAAAPLRRRLPRRGARARHRLRPRRVSRACSARPGSRRAASTSTRTWSPTRAARGSRSSTRTRSSTSKASRTARSAGSSRRSSSSTCPRRRWCGCWSSPPPSCAQAACSWRRRSTRSRRSRCGTTTPISPTRSRSCRRRSSSSPGRSGFGSVELRYLNAPEERLVEPADPVIAANVSRLNELLFGPLDYAIVART